MLLAAPQVLNAVLDGAALGVPGRAFMKLKRVVPHVGRLSVTRGATLCIGLSVFLSIILLSVILLSVTLSLMR